MMAMVSLLEFRALVTAMQVKVRNLEQDIIDQKCPHIKVLQAQIFDLEASNKQLSDNLASRVNSTLKQ